MTQKIITGIIILVCLVLIVFHIRTLFKATDEKPSIQDEYFKKEIEAKNLEIITLKKYIEEIQNEKIKQNDNIATDTKLLNDLDNLLRELKGESSGKSSSNNSRK